jgi:phosphatidylserine/phosphatidylglycerophosphate/cardiolipin synthase-like enzyme
MNIALVSTADFVAALHSARHIELSSYTLHPGAVLGALDAAAKRGADVHVRLDGEPLGAKLRIDNAAAVAELRAAGADARLTGEDEPQMHMKAAIVDGVTWLDDRNWAGTSNERIVRVDDPRAVATTKSDALELEASVIANAGTDELDVESESFGTGAIYSALLKRAEAHFPTRLIVAGREVAEPRNVAERTCLAHLAALGVDVRVGNARAHDLNDKLAISSNNAWVGSANATYSGGPMGEQSDWGVASHDSQLVNGLRSAFEANWLSASTVANVH